MKAPRQTMSEAVMPVSGKKKGNVARIPPAYSLVGGPKNAPLMLEQSGLRYATLFSSQETIGIFQQACCSVDSYTVRHLASRAEVVEELERTRKFGCSLLLIDPPGPEINQRRSQVLAAFLRNGLADSEL
jgi:hypothetical protein